MNMVENTAPTAASCGAEVADPNACQKAAVHSRARTPSTLYTTVIVSDAQPGSLVSVVFGERRVADELLVLSTSTGECSGRWLTGGASVGIRNCLLQFVQATNCPASVGSSAYWYWQLGQEIGKT